MSSLFLNDLNISPDPEITAHMPESFQLMLKIQQKAKAEFNEILTNIEAEKYTLEDVMRARGIPV